MLLTPALTALAASTLVVYAWGADNTHVDNHSKWTILVTTSYPGGDSAFINRAISPGGSDVDTYNPVSYVNLDVQVQDAAFSNHFKIGSDDSVIAQDTPDNMYGVDFYLNDGSGNPQLTITGPFGDERSGLLTTIFGPGPPPAPDAPPSEPPAPPGPESGSATPGPDEDPTPQLIFGDDTRTPALTDGKATYPNVGFIQPMQQNNDKKFPPGTAFLLPGNKIATAGHVLFERGTNVKLDSFDVYFGQTGPTTYLEVAHGQTSDCLIPQQFTDSLSGSARRAYDFALCSVKRPNENAAVQPFQLASQPVNQLPITLVGYPPQVLYPDKFKTQFPEDGTPFMATCDATYYDGHTIEFGGQQPEGDDLWGYTCPATAGQSGSPITGTDGKILGVHWGSFGPGVGLNFAANLVNAPDNPLPVPEPS